jgi:periplasmic divalent cation tolerance protein
VENDPRPCLVLTTWPADQPVDVFVRGMVEARLAACVHVSGAGRSTYRWEGAVEDAAEHQLVIKTTRGRLAALGAYVRGAHPYAVPEWLEIEAAGSAAYTGWIAASVAVG